MSSDLLDRPLLPPPFEPVIRCDGNAFGRAIEEAEKGSGAGTFAWSPGPTFVEGAVVLEPSLPLRRAWPAALVAQLAARDALGVLGPPEKPVTLAWPDLIRIDGATAGVVSLRASGDADDLPPEWLVVSVALRLVFAGGAAAPGEMPDQTSLFEEGYGDVTPQAFLESYARHLMNWLDSWQREGLQRAARHWIAHSDLTADGRTVLDAETGDLLLGAEEAAASGRRRLAEALEHADGRILR